MLEFSHFDRRHYPVVSVREGYREWLASYETTVEDERDLVPLEALDSVPLELRRARGTLIHGSGARRRSLVRLNRPVSET